MRTTIRASIQTCLCIIGLTCFHFRGAAQSLTNGLIAYYPFNGNANDESGHGNDGTVAGAALTADRFGNAGRAYAFAGSPSSEIIINHTNLMLQPPFSFSGWVNWTGGTENPRFISVGAWEVGLFWPGAYRPINFNNATTSGLYDAESTNDFTQNTWHHVVAVRSTGAMMIYVDGLLHHTVSVIDPLLYPAGFGTVWLPKLGRNGYLSSPYDSFAGGIDDVRIYNRALSGPDVTSLFALESAPPPANNCANVPPGLVSWWRAEGNALDSADGNNGTLLSGVSFTAGEAGQAFSFDANLAGVNVGMPTNLQLQNFTIESWIRRYSPSSSSWDIYGIGSIFSCAWGGYGLGIRDNGKLHVTKVGYSNVETTGLTLTDTNGFHHVAVTKDGTNVVIYLDGVSESMPPYDPGFFFSNGPFAIGARGTDYAVNFRGAIDEVSVYNRALSSAEIQALFNAGSAGKCPTNPPPPPCAPAPSGLVGWWPGEGNANDVIGGNNATLEGGATFAPGEVGQGFRLDGTNSYVQVPDSDALKPTNVTVEAWVWLDPNVTAPRLDYIIFKKNTWDYLFEGYSLLKQSLPNGDGTYTDRFSFVVSSGGNQVITYSTTAVQRGIWYHVAGTYDGNQLKLWVNGVAEASAIAGFPLDYGTLPVFIGTSGQPEPYNGKLAGIIDEPSIYARALSASEIQAIFNAGSAGKCAPPPPAPPCTPSPSGLVSWWRAENNALDSADGNNGTVAGATYVPGEAGQAFDFNGNYSGVQLGNPANLQMQTFTIEAWVKRHSATQGTLDPYHPDNGSFLHYDVGGYAFAPANDGRLLLGRTGVSGVYSSALRLTDTNNFHHVAVTTTGSNVVFYLDGVAEAVGPYDPGYTFTGPVAIGGRGGDLAASFYGAIDELSVYNRALSAAEIQALFNAGSAGKCSTNPPPSPALVPVLSYFNPPVAAPGTEVWLFGTNFSPIMDHNIVYFGAVRASVHFADPDGFGVAVTVPVGATYAPITVTVNGLTAASGTSFQPTFAGGSTITTSNFAPRVDLAAPNGPIFTAIADLDGDGKPDLIVNNAYAHSLSLYRNTSTTGTLNLGSFAAPVDFFVGGDPDNPYGLAVADMDGDGKLDVIICDRIAGQVAIYRNVSSPGSLTTASLAAPVRLSVGSDVRHVAVGDLNGDGRPDIVAANWGASTISLIQNIGSPGDLSSNSFAAHVDLPSATGAYDVAIGDLDGDGKLDVAVSGYDSLSIFRNINSGGVLDASSFAPRVDLPIPADSGIGLVIGDLDGDGKPDLMVTTYLSQDIAVFRNVSTPGSLTAGSFEARVDFAPGCRGHTLALGDLNGDGKADLSFVGELPSQLSVYQNLSAPGSFTTASLARTDFGTGWNAWGVSVGDLDGDGRPDVVFCNSYDNTISIYRNIVGSEGSTCPGLPSGLVSWWRAENNAFDSVGGNDGALAGGATFGAGEVGQAFTFNGSGNAVTVGSAPNLQLQDFTIETWIKRSDPTLVTPVPGQDSVFFSYGSAGYGFGLSSLGRPFLTRIDIDETHAETTISDLNFHHVAMTKNGTNVVFYVDGVPYSAPPFLSTFTFYTPAALGARGDNLGNSFLGTVDELSIYSRALSAAEIQAIFNAGSAGKCGSPAAPYLIDLDLQGANLTHSLKTGFAAVGVSTNDFWNYYTRDDGLGGWRTSGAVSNLALVDGTVTSVGVMIDNTPGAWSNGSTDPMYNEYMYPLNGGNATITFSNLPDGRYDVLPYASDGNFEVTVGAVSYGIRHTYDYPLSNPPIWTEGVQYARFTNVQVSAGQSLVLTVRPGTGNYAIISGLQISRVSTGVAQPPFLLTQPTNQFAIAGDTVRFAVNAGGPGPLSYQWSFNGSLTDGTNSDLVLTGVQAAQAGTYSVTVANAYGSVTSSNAVLVVLTPTTNPLYDVDLQGTNLYMSMKTGFAAIGRATNDFWNYYTRDDGLGGWRTSGTIGNLVLADGTVTSVGMLIDNTPGAWSIPSSDPMYAEYMYPLDGGNATITVTNLPPGHYSLLAYSGDASYEVTVDGVSYGIRHTFDSPLVNPPVWMEGVQYARFTNVTIATGQDLVLTVRPGVGGYAIISGLQIEQTAVPVLPHIATQPTGRTVYVGSNTTFTVFATGDPPLSYQWWHADVPLPGKTNASLTLTGVQFTDAGNYSVVVSNVFGTATSSNALLTVLPIPPCTTPPAGLVSWWKFENNLVDNWDSNNGYQAGSTLVGFGAGKVALAANFGSLNNFIGVADAPSLRFSNALTIEAWVKPAGLSGSSQQTIVSKGTYSLSLTNTAANVRLVFSVQGNSLASSVISSQILPFSQWTFVVATYDGAALRIYTNGTLSAQNTYTGGIASNLSPLGIGGIPTDPGRPTLPFIGQMDEVSLYSRALTVGEIQSIYASDFIGKCQSPPILMAQPTSQSVPQNEDALFSVSVVGSKPMKLQWRFNETPIPGETNSTLLLEHVQNGQIGFYNVVISNALGSVKSASADLKLLPPLSCTPAPSNMISWWTGDGNSLDAVDGNNGSFNGIYNPTGKVGRAFSFISSGMRVAVPSSASLNFGSNANFSIECWIKALPSTPTPGQLAIVPIVEKGLVSSGSPGYSLYLNQGRLAFRIAASPAFPTNVAFASSSPDLRDGKFHHVAVTLIRSNSTGGSLFVDGQVVRTFDATTKRGDLSNANPLLIGGPTTSPSIEGAFNGSIDEVTIYSRALSAAEIQAIAGAGSAGKCKVPATIVTPPANQTVTVGSNATFLVVATGTPNLRYQWLKNNGALTIPSATNSSLNLSNVQFAAAGTYSVRVMNGFGTNTSPNAMLVVQAPNAPVSIDPMPGVLHADQKDGRMHLQFVGTPGQQYFIEASTNLVDWTPLGVATDLDGGLFEFVDDASAGLNARFYRITTP